MQSTGASQTGRCCAFHTPQELRDFIKQLLQRKPAYRLGQGASGAGAIKKHPWFNGFDWDAFTAKKLKAPYLAVVSSMQSVSPSVRHDALRGQPWYGPHLVL
jgi:hypothetical protein